MLIWLLNVFGENKGIKGKDCCLLLKGVDSREGAVVLPRIALFPLPSPPAVMCSQALLNTYSTANMDALRISVPLKKI